MRCERKLERAKDASCGWGGPALGVAANKHGRSGLTLLELVVVLAILAALSTVAVQSLAQSMDQTRFEITQRLLADIRTACVGDTASSTNSADSIRGFVADVGRMPTTLDELLINGNNLPPFAVAPASASGQPHDDVLAPRGWRGPYVKLPIGATSLRDGWGRPLSFLLGATTGQLETVASLGADGLQTLATSSVNYNTDLAITMTPQDYRGAMITGQVYRLDNGQRVAPMATTVRVRLFGPDPSGTASTGLVANATDVDPLVVQSGTGEFRYQFTSPTIARVCCGRDRRSTGRRSDAHRDSPR